MKEWITKNKGPGRWTKEGQDQVKHSQRMQSSEESNMVVLSIRLAFSTTLFTPISMTETSTLLMASGILTTVAY